MFDQADSQKPSSLIPTPNAIAVDQSSFGAIPEFLYHHTPSHNRPSILQKGLLLAYDQTSDQAGMGAIFLTDVASPGFHTDVWAVATQGLHIEGDPTANERWPEETWYAHYADISPDHLHLLNLSPADLERRVLDNFAESEDLAVIGFLTPKGKLIDCGPSQAYPEEMGYFGRMEHKAFAARISSSLAELLDAGFIRVCYLHDLNLEVRRPLTPQQIKTLHGLIDRADPPLDMTIEVVAPTPSDGVRAEGVTEIWSGQQKSLNAISLNRLLRETSAHAIPELSL